MGHIWGIGQVFSTVRIAEEEEEEEDGPLARELLEQLVPADGVMHHALISPPNHVLVVDALFDGLGQLLLHIFRIRILNMFEDSPSRVFPNELLHLVLIDDVEISSGVMESCHPLLLLNARMDINHMRGFLKYGSDSRFG